MYSDSCACAAGYLTRCLQIVQALVYNIVIIISWRNLHTSIASGHIMHKWNVNGTSPANAQLDASTTTYLGFRLSSDKFGCLDTESNGSCMTGKIRCTIYEQLSIILTMDVYVKLLCEKWASVVKILIFIWREDVGGHNHISVLTTKPPQVPP